VAEIDYVLLERLRPLVDTYGLGLVQEAVRYLENEGDRHVAMLDKRREWPQADNE
jgi:hypothetical protein